MSSSLFANRKNALGFAGVILAIAVVGTYAAGAFLSFLEEPDEPQVAVVTESEAPKPAPTQPATTWSDGGFADDGLSDDWGAGAAEPAFNGGRSKNSDAELGEPDFGDYSPDSVPPGPRAQQGSSRSGSASPAVRSGAAPGAPRLEAPGGGGNSGGGTLTVES